MIEKVEVTPLYEGWVEATRKLFGGLDIFTIDAIHDRATGIEQIMEVNGTSSGLYPDCAAEDNATIRDIAIAKLNEQKAQSTSRPVN